MFGIHRRNRSLIPVSELSKYDTKEPLLVQQEKQLELELESEQELEDAKEPRLDRQQSSQLALIYTLFLAEAIMAASMSSQINMLDASLSDNATNCSSNLRNQYLLSILQCMYCFGSACGVFWGRLADRQGRRRVALGGLVGMSACCVAMGFVRSFAGCVVLRAISGVASSAATTAGLAMLADSSVDSIERTRRVARLPLLAACGAVGPLLQSVVARLGEGSMTGIWESWPILSGQIACASLIGMIAIGEACCLKETLCMPISTQRELGDDEKGALLARDTSFHDTNSLSLSVVDHGEQVCPTASWHTADILRAPSFFFLLASFSILSLHTATFDVLLPHLGHTPHSHGTAMLPCGWRNTITLITKTAIALWIMHAIPKTLTKTTTLSAYRRISFLFPVLYVLVPLTAFLITVSDTHKTWATIISIASMLAKHLLEGSAWVLLILLVFAMAPEASQTGTIIGFVSLANLFRALAVGMSGMTYYLSDDYSTVVVNGLLWAVLAVLAVSSVLINSKLRDSPLVGTDYPAECLAWQYVFDAECEETMI